MSRIALVPTRRQASRDKTRVSSIYKRRVTPVPEEGAASTEDPRLAARTSGLELSWMAPLEVSTRRPQFGLRDLASVLLAERLGRPICTPSYGVGCVHWLPSPRLDCHPGTTRVEGSLVRRPPRHPAEPIQAIRLPADQSRLRAFGRGDLPAHHRQGPRSVRPPHPARPWLSPTSHKLLVLLLARRTTMLSPSTVSPLPCACAPIR